MKQNIIKNGIIAGVAAIGYVLLFYYTRKEYIFTAFYTFSSLIFYIFFMHQAAKKVVNEDFNIVLKTAFGVFVVANLIYYGFDYILFNVIDPSLADMQKNEMIEYFASAAKSVEEQNQVTQSIRDSSYHGIKGISFSFAKGAIAGFGLSILITYLLKRQ